MKACCYRFESCTTCPECGGRITPHRPLPPRGAELDAAIAQRFRRERSDPVTDTGFQEQLQSDYYSGTDRE